MQGFRPSSPGSVDPGLGEMMNAFPNGSFPTGAIHEFVTTGAETAAASSGFVAGLISTLMQSGGTCIWVSAARKIFPPALAFFGIEPEKVIFLDVQREREALWAMEEALKCKGLGAVIGEIPEISFPISRRLQLAVEQSHTTGFVVRHRPRNSNPIASVARWKIAPLASTLEPGMPGLGHPRWTVALEKIRNGQPGSWQVEWSAGRFHLLAQQELLLERLSPQAERRKTG